MEKILKYKGVTLSENNLGNYLAGEGRYAVYCGTKKFVFDTIKAFKDAVNGINPYKDVCRMTTPYIENGKWGGVDVEQFRKFILENS